MSISSSDKPPRRKRYRGSHPRSFEEKYKELSPAAYPAEGEKVRSRGQTPAGTHVPVLLGKVLEVLRLRPGMVVADCTLGHGGHAQAIYPRIQPGGRVIGLDRDPEALERTSRRLLAAGIEVLARRSSFAGIGKVLGEQGLAGLDGLLADLGASSMQIDDPARGFSFKSDGPLDMRMDRSRGATAEEWLRGTEEEDLGRVLREWGEEPDWKRVAAAVKAWAASDAGQLRTRGLVQIVLRAKGLPPRFRRESPLDLHPAARTFQAVRMAVNGEVESLRALLRILPHVLAPGGRAAVIAFHGVEDRLIEAAFLEGLRSGLYSAGSGEAIRPAHCEVASNPRARSARLRWVERQGA
jgi:16S rRNA (cytosine1402-N4)-methyltransferase